MPEDLLLEPETAAPVAEVLENIEDIVGVAKSSGFSSGAFPAGLVRIVLRELGWAVEGMKGSALTFENAWRSISREVAKGQTTEMQAARPRLLSAFEKRLGLLKQAHHLAKWYSTLGGAGIPNPDVLLPEIAGLERLKTSVFDHWQTADDLEELAARDYPLTTADLDQIIPDTDVALTTTQMAEAFDRLGAPTTQQDVELSVDPDDYPLF